MSQMNMKNAKTQLFLALIVTVLPLLTPAAYAAAPGITGPTFSLAAKPAFITQPDGSLVYSWGYGCNGAPTGYLPAKIATTSSSCSDMQIPGPTLIVHEGDTVQVTLTNSLPTAAGNTSILFPGFNVTATGGVDGLLTKEADHTSSVTYTFTATTPGTHSYYSGTQGDLQVEMGLYGAIIVLPAHVPGACIGATATSIPAKNRLAQSHWGESDFRLSQAAYDNDKTCYDREYLFQFSEMDPRIHRQAEEQAGRACTDCMNVATEPYHPAFFMINGRSMPDLMDPNYASEYPHQPYNGNPHMHPGELVLLRIIGQGRWQHPFHEHGNHVRVLARDGNLILSSTSTNLAGPLLFTTTTTPGQTIDGIYYWTGKGLNWDAYGHNPASNDPLAKLTCTPDANGYNTGSPTAINYFEWCQDHNKPMQATPLGDVASGGPVTLPSPTLFANGAWYGGSPYLGPNATTRAVGFTGTTPPSGTVVNPPTEEAGFSFMWHSHNEREITTNNIFPGGMMMMMLVAGNSRSTSRSNRGEERCGSTYQKRQQSRRRYSQLPSSFW
jgi:FtsP/CotA-like multicopper oxidase with cupredoxin domain